MSFAWFWKKTPLAKSVTKDARMGSSGNAILDTTKARTIGQLARACGDSCAGSPIRVGGLVAGVVVVPVAGGEQQMLERLLEDVHGGEHEEDDLREERDGLHARVPAPKPHP